ncbi:hypothetical protein SDC9_166716 [bioreactor metagenome]|uniref:Uncharacterized protein n=1 Tax=bioreactor metagenome TaxID=1076179 RepID=A0A645FXS9_9ZZZZ
MPPIQRLGEAAALFLGGEIQHGGGAADQGGPGAGAKVVSQVWNAREMGVGVDKSGEKELA